MQFLHAEEVLKLLNFHDREQMLDCLLEIWKKYANEEAEEPEPEQRIMMAV
jgi:hypothetical protein